MIHLQELVSNSFVELEESTLPPVTLKKKHLFNEEEKKKVYQDLHSEAEVFKAFPVGSWL